MRRRRRSASFHEPSLVPLADMLCNTVGIVLMILIFTVLAAGGAVVAKRLPMERQTDAAALLFLCTADRRLLPVNDELQERFVREVKETRPSGLAEVMEAVRQRRVEDDYFVVTGFAGFALGQVRAGMQFEPKPQRGDTADDLSAGKAKLLDVLAANDPTKRFVFFVVKPECINVFTMARELAVSRSYGTGWGPHGPDQPLLIGLTGGGRTLTRSD